MFRSSHDAIIKKYISDHTNYITIVNNALCAAIFTADK